MKNAVEMVRLINVLIPDTHFEMIPADVRKNKPAQMFYSLLFKVGEVKFLFKGVDW